MKRTDELLELVTPVRKWLLENGPSKTVMIGAFNTQVLSPEIDIYYAEDETKIMFEPVLVTLRQARNRKGVTAEEAANHIGVTDGTIYSWEKKVSYPTANFIQIILDYYGLKWGDIDW